MLGLKRVPIAFAGALIALSLVGGSAGAQGFSLNSVIGRFLAASAVHPAAIVNGSCTTATAKPAFKLNNVKAGKTKTGDAAALPASWSQTTVDAKFADLVKSPYAVVIAGETNQPATVACGVITGTPTGNTRVIAIRPVGTSKDEGVAWLRQDGNKTNVTVLFANGIVPPTQHPANAKNAPASTTPPTPYQAGVYTGTCAKPSAKAEYALNAIGKAAPAAATPAAGSSSTTAANQNAVEMSTTTVSTKLQDLLKTPYVIAIQPKQSASSPAKSLACGAIGGEMTGKDLAFALGALNGSHDVAFAWLQENGNKTGITLFLVPKVTT